MTAAVGSSVVGHVCLQVMVLHSGILLMFDRMLGGEDGQPVDAFRNLPGPFRPAYSFRATPDS